MLYYKLYTFRFATKFTKYSQSTNATSLHIKLIVSILQPETANIRLFFPTNAATSQSPNLSSL